MPTKSLRKNPGWRLDQETLDIVGEARVALQLANHEVIALWAKQWKDGPKKSLEQMNNESAEMAYARMIVPDPLPESNPVQYQATEETEPAVGVLIVPNKPVVEERPMAVRVETPYQIERNRKLTELRAKLERGTEAVSGALDEAGGVVASETLVVPFEVLVNGERHRVIEMKGRRVLAWVGSGGNLVLKKNLTPQEAVIYWRERVKA